MSSTMITPEQITASCAKILATPEGAILAAKHKEAPRVSGALGALSKMVFQDLRFPDSPDKAPSMTDIGLELEKQLSV